MPPLQIGLGLLPELQSAHDYVVRRRSQGASDQEIITEMVAGKGPCASTSGAISCDTRFAAEAVATAPRDGGTSRLIKGALLGLGIFYVLSKFKRKR